MIQDNPLQPLQLNHYCIYRSSILLREMREKLQKDGAMADSLTGEASERLERDGAMTDGLIQTNKIASKGQKSQRELERRN